MRNVGLSGCYRGRGPVSKVRTGHGGTYTAQNGTYFMYFGDAFRSNGAITPSCTESLMILDTQTRLLSLSPSRSRKDVLVRKLPST